MKIYIEILVLFVVIITFIVLDLFLSFSRRRALKKYEREHSTQVIEQPISLSIQEEIEKLNKQSKELQETIKKLNDERNTKGEIESGGIAGTEQTTEFANTSSNGLGELEGRSIFSSTVVDRNRKNCSGIRKLFKRRRK